MGKVLRMVEAAAADADADGAWLRLWAWIEPTLWDLVDRPRFASHRAHTEDARRRIIAAIRTQLAADRCHQLQRYLDSRRLHPDLGFERWLRMFAKRVGASQANLEPAAPVRRRSARTLAK